jgi:hypothetical protein
MAVAVVLVAVVLATATPRATAASPSTSAFSGLGTWVDVFDYTARLQHNGGPPPFVVASVDDLRQLGVGTLYLQIANPDDAPASSLTDAKLVKAIVARARRDGIKVVAWYLPSLVDPKRDAAMLRHVAALPVDGIGLDLEATDVADVPTRNARTVAFTKQAHALAKGRPVAAIVYPAIQLELLNPVLWPSFPYRQLAPFIDVWMPMVYYTFRSGPLRNAYTYSVENVKLLRTRVGGDVPVHIVGGIADLTTTTDIVDLRRAARTTHALGWSLYDFVTTSSAAWPYLG